MRVEVRALIQLDGKIVTTIETRDGLPHSALPGGGVERWETLEDALIREVREETDLIVTPGRLLYIAQIVSRFALHDLDLVFQAAAEDHADGRFQLVDPADSPDVLPPILDRVAIDAPLDWPDAPYWIGNIFRDNRHAR